MCDTEMRASHGAWEVEGVWSRAILIALLGLDHLGLDYQEVAARKSPTVPARLARRHSRKAHAGLADCRGPGSCATRHSRPDQPVTSNAIDTDCFMGLDPAGLGAVPTITTE